MAGTFTQADTPLSAGEPGCSIHSASGPLLPLPTCPDAAFTARELPRGRRRSLRIPPRVRNRPKLFRLPRVTREKWAAPALVLTGIVALYADTLTAGFINDDYLFLEQTRRYGLWGSLWNGSGLANFFRPLSREVWFGVLTPLSGGEPFLFHLAQLALFVLALVLLVDLVSVFVPRRGPAQLVAPPVLAGVTWFALLPFQRVSLTWVSCSQDLLALVLVLASVAWFRRGRILPALLAYTAATLAKETALALPLALFVWAWRVEGASPRAALRRVAPFALAALPWAAGEGFMRQHAPVAAPLRFQPDHLAAAFVHMAQSLAGIEHAAGWLGSWTAARPSALAFALLAVAARWLPERAERTPAPAPSPDPARGAVPFALAWIGAFTLPVWPVCYQWSSYYYTLAAVGGALLVAVLLSARIARWSWIALAGALVWWHAAGADSPAFGIEQNAWLGTSHFTPFYLERAAGLSKQLRASLTRTIPKVGQGTRFFFASIPSWAGFQTGNGPNIRQLYHDDTIESYFYSQFAESTADRRPCEFMFWNGADFDRLHTLTTDPFFQVGTDLLLLEKPAGASWAFRRGLETGGARVDHLYWLGWALLWDGQRDAAERAWQEWGAHDDTSARVLWLRKAKGSLEDKDTLTARRQLVEAVRCGIGHPEAHAMLGLLLSRINVKYALLETRVAAELNPRDWLARRDLVSGLVSVQLDDPARRQLEQLKTLLPDWRRDTVAVRLDGMLAARGAPAGGVAVFGPGGLR